jgi:hypothetical protein
MTSVSAQTLWAHGCLVFNEVRGDDSLRSPAAQLELLESAFNYQQVPTSTWRGAPRDWWNNLYRVVENTNGAINADLPFVGDAAG